MNKQLKWVLRVINIGCFLALILSCIVPIERKETLTSNIDVSSYGNLHSIPRIGSVTDEKQMKLKFNLYDEKLYGVNLYFGVDGDDENGKVTCAIEYNNETLAKQTFSVKELASLTEGSSLNSVEILLDDFEKRDGDYFRLDNITLGWTPKLDTKWISNLRVYATVKNAFTITKYSVMDPTSVDINGLEPGISGLNVYPIARSFTFGIQISY